MNPCIVVVRRAQIARSVLHAAGQVLVESAVSQPSVLLINLVYQGLLIRAHEEVLLELQAVENQTLVLVCFLL